MAGTIGKTFQRYIKMSGISSSSTFDLQNFEVLDNDVTILKFYKKTLDKKKKYKIYDACKTWVALGNFNKSKLFILVISRWPDLPNIRG